MADTARQSEAILAAARASLADQRAGGRRMGKAIGTRSAALRRRHTIGKIKRITAALLTILIAAFAAGLVLDGIGFTGLMLTGAALVASLLLLARYPRLSAPQPASLTKGPVAHMVGTTQLWLESQRPALPPPAQTLVGQIGHQLDLLALQLDGLDDTAPAAGDVRRLIGEYLPLVVNAYAAIPVPLRQQSQDEQAKLEQTPHHAHC